MAVIPAPTVSGRDPTGLRIGNPDRTAARALAGAAGIEPLAEWPAILRTSSSHHEGAKRLWSIGTKEFYGTDGRVVKVGCTRLAWEGGSFTEIKGADFLLDADLVLLSMGFVLSGFASGLGVRTGD